MTALKAVTVTSSSTTQTELDDFPTLTQRYQRELLAHCYRMSGSVHEAEDLVQETFLRAWRAAADFEGRSSVRTWLYRIATNVCLTNLEAKPRRPLPAGLGTADSMAGDALELDHEVAWLEPVPDAAVVVTERETDPARLRRRAPAPAGPPARGADPARRAAVVGRRGRRGARHHVRRGQLRAPARARPARRARPHRRHRRARPRPPRSSSSWSGTSTRSGARTSTRSSGC